MYFRTSDKMKISDKLAIRREVGGGGGAKVMQFINFYTNIFNFAKYKI